MAQAADSLSIELETLNHVLGLVETFRAFDSDNDGWINAQELRGIMGSLGYNNVTERDAEGMIGEGADGQLSMSEFLNMNTGDLELGGLAVLKTAFEGLDGEEHDVVTGEELYKVVKTMGIELSQDDCHDIVDSMDGDGDGAITLSDFKLIVNSVV